MVQGLPNMQNTLSLLNTVLFEGLSQDDIQVALSVFRVSHHQQGDYVFSSGEDASCIYLLQEGMVKVSYITPDGAEDVLAMFESGDIFGELFLGKYRYRIGFAQAIENSTVLRLSEAHLYDLISDYPQIGINFIKHLADAKREAMARMHALLRTDAKSRLLGVLLSLSRQKCCVYDSEFILNENITQEDLANMTGLNRSTVSSLVNQLRRDGVLGGTRRKLTVDLDAVKALLDQNGFELLQ